MIKLADSETPAAAWGDSNQGSWWNTFNPFSQIFGMTDRLPSWWVNMFPNSTGGQRAAHISFKVGADAALAAGLVALWRGIGHINRMSEIAKSDNPAKGMKSQLSTTFAGPLDPSQKKKAAQEAYTLQKPDAVSAENVMAASLPIGAVLLAASAAYRTADWYFDNQRNKSLDKTISQKSDVLKQLIKTRSRVAKGNASDSEVRRALGRVADDDLYVKQAALQKHAVDLGDIFRGGVGSFAALSCLLLGASAVGSYYYFKKANENNVRYRAMKKGLKEYARTKSGFTPVAIIPDKARQFFASIDDAGPQSKKEAPAKQSVRQEQPVLTETYNKPISLTL